MLSVEPGLIEIQLQSISQVGVQTYPYLFVSMAMSCITYSFIESFFQNVMNFVKEVVHFWKWYNLYIRIL